MRAVPGGPKSRTRRARLIATALLIALGLALLLALGLGAVATPPGQVLAVLSGQGDDLTRRLLLEFRLPRVLLAALCGAMFAASGALLQAVVRNPLASPDLLGVGAGAGLAVTLLLLVTPALPAWALPWVGALGAWLSFGLVILLSRRGGGLAPVRLALIGVAVGAGLAAVQALLLARAPYGAGAALAFLNGTLYGADTARLLRVLPWALVLLPASLLLARRLDLLTFGDGVARSLGLRVERARLLTLTVAVALAGAAVTGGGVLGFVGLLAPHLARLLVGGLHARLLPVAMLTGALLVVLADTLGRSLLPPTEVPAGILTTLLGAPYFLWLLRRSGRRA